MVTPTSPVTCVVEIEGMATECVHFVNFSPLEFEQLSPGKASCDRVTYLLSWCFEPSQTQRITSGLNTKTSLYLQVIHFASHHTKSLLFFLSFFSLFIIRRHSTRAPASSRMTYFILRAYTGTGVSHSQHREKKSGEVLEKMQVTGPEG